MSFATSRRHRVPAARLIRDAVLILVGSFVFALGVDCFEVPNGLAAGGLTGLATVLHELAGRAGIPLPIGTQTIAMNVALLLYVEFYKHDHDYVMHSIAGILVSGVMTDALAPVLPDLGGGDLLLSALWGGALQGAGIGIVFLSGSNTGGTDIINQLISRRTGIPVGSISIMVDAVIISLSVPVFSLGNALYATIAMFICGNVIDFVVDGPRTQRVAYIISERHDDIANLIMYDLGRGCTELAARGVWSGNPRPMLMVVLGRSETVRLKQIVAHADPDAIVIISEVHEAFGQGFGQLDD
jgi:uncharacterized membrane-anchored protein YitT (DUF2179 family)